MKKKTNILSQPNDGKLISIAFRTPKSKFYFKIDFGKFSLSSDIANKWFLTESGEIVGLICVISEENKLYLFGRVLTNHKDFFERPVKSRDLNIYATEYFADRTEEERLFDIAHVKCKLVRICYNNDSDVYIPLLHTLSSK